MRSRAFVVAGCAVAALVSLAACASSEAERAPVAYVPGEDYEVSQSVAPAATETQSNTQEPAPLWPRTFTSGDTTFATYEPTITSWKDDKLQARVAVAVYTPGAKTPKYGEVLFECPTQTDAARRLVTLGEVRITRARFPTARDKEAAYADALRSAPLAEARTVAVDRLQHEIAYGATGRPAPAQAASKAAPAILFTDRPASRAVGDRALVRAARVGAVDHVRAVLRSGAAARERAGHVTAAHRRRPAVPRGTAVGRRRCHPRQPGRSSARDPAEPLGAGPL